MLPVPHALLLKGTTAMTSAKANVERHTPVKTYEKKSQIGSDPKI